MSALTGENINESFNYLIKEIYQRNKVASEVKSSGMKLSRNQVVKAAEENKKEKKCC